MIASASQLLGLQQGGCGVDNKVFWAALIGSIIGSVLGLALWGALGL